MKRVIKRTRSSRYLKIWTKKENSQYNKNECATKSQGYQENEAEVQPGLIYQHNQEKNGDEDNKLGAGGDKDELEESGTK